MLPDIVFLVNKDYQITSPLKNRQRKCLESLSPRSCSAPNWLRYPVILQGGE